jgi:protein-tyrosine kinase
MSIVDKSLRRLREPEKPPAQRPSASSVARSREVVEIDIEALRSAGVLPFDDLEQRRRDEEFRRIKWPVLAAAFGSATEQVPDGDLVLVTSSVPDEGKTFIALNLAFSIAKERTTGVLLVDGDIERQQLSEHCGVLGRPGLTDLLAAPDMPPERVVVDTNIPQLSILPAGARVSNGPELLGGAGFESLVRWFSATHNGYVLLIDSPPMLARTEAQVFARGVGQVIFVIRADHTLRGTVQDALSQLPGGPLVRCIANQTQRSSLVGYYGDYADYGDTR